MGDYTTEMLHMATAGAFADCGDPLVEAKKDWAVLAVTKQTKRIHIASITKERAEALVSRQGSRFYRAVPMSELKRDYSASSGWVIKESALTEVAYKLADLDPLERIVAVIVHGETGHEPVSMPKRDLLKQAVARSKKTGTPATSADFAKVVKAMVGMKLLKADPGNTVSWNPSAKVRDLTEYEAADLDSWWKAARTKLIKGSKATRDRRMSGCIKSLRSLRDGGIKVSGQSQTHLNPVPKRERNSEDQPKDSTPGRVDEAVEETTMNLSDAVSRFRDIEEANIAAPAPGRKGPDGAQKAAKSRFKQTQYAGAAPADAEPKQAATNSTAGVKGPGYDSSSREYVDNRFEHEEGYQFTQAEKGMGIDDFDGGEGRTLAEDRADLAFADEMLAGGHRIDGTQRRLAAFHEANIPAPKSGRKNPGGAQLNPKSRFRKPYQGPGKDIYGPKGIPADAEAKAAAERSTAGVSGPGYTADGREETDVRYEDVSQQRPAARQNTFADSDVGAFDPTQFDYPEMDD